MVKHSGLVHDFSLSSFRLFNWQLSVAASEKRSVLRPSDFPTHRLCCFHLSVCLSQSHLGSYILLECLAFLFEKCENCVQGGYIEDVA